MLASTVALMVAASVFFFTLVVVSVLSKAYEQYQEKYVVKQMTDLSDMFLFIDARQMVVLNFASMFLVGAFSWVVFGPVFGAVAFVFGFFVPGLVVDFYRKRRIARFNQQLTDALQAMANALRAGLTFQQAMEQISREGVAPLGQEFSLFVKESKLGVPVEEAFLNMAKRVGSDDLELVVTSTNIARQLGGNMSEMYETLAGTIRERFRLEGKIQSMTSQGKMQGWIVGAMPLVMGLIFNGMRPDLMGPLMQHWAGWVLVAVVCLMEIAGMFIIRRIVNIDV